MTAVPKEKPYGPAGVPPPARPRTVRLRVLAGLKAVGAFRLARALTGGGLQILCFHGISEHDEHRYHPKLFLTRESFERRLDALDGNGFAVLPLDEALRRLSAGSLPRSAVAITFDDGWRGVRRFALDALAERRMPATIYVPTEIAVEGCRVYNIAIERLFALAAPRPFDLSTVDPALAGIYDLADPTARTEAADTVIRHVKRTVPLGETEAWIARIAAALGVDAAAIVERDLYRLMSPEEIAATAGEGAGRIDFQLHSHKHELDFCDAAAFKSNITTNKSLLVDILGYAPVHFCYPSGRYFSTCFPWLEELGVASATTCRAGYNHARTPLYELRRFLDGEHLSQIEFEAELFGVLELARRAKAALARLRGRQA